MGLEAGPILCLTILNDCMVPVARMTHLADGGGEVGLSQCLHVLTSGCPLSTFAVLETFVIFPVSSTCAKINYVSHMFQETHSLPGRIQLSLEAAGQVGS